MNDNLPARHQKKNSQITRIVLFISFIILFGRLIYAIPAAVEHYQQTKTPADAPSPMLSPHLPSVK